MNSEQWQRVKELFEEAQERSPMERAVFLAQASADDEEVRREVESLLAAHEGDSGFMNTPVGNLLLGDKPMLAAGQRFGHYEGISPLAEGGMGQVYVAVDSRLGRKVALKLLPLSYTNNADRVHRFEQEARAASALNHPNIITIHEIGQTDSLQFIATEFVDGKTLREHMTDTSMTIGEVLEVASQVASALQAAHEAGIVHRDIKPENIMLRRDQIVKVLDFGLAKLAEQEVAAVDPQRTIKATVNTNPGMVMGTVGYMSPEQARGQEVDARSDIWSLGVVLYEMAAGRAPFEGETPSHVIVSILENEPARLSPGSEVPTELDRIVAKALSKERTERYQTAGEMTLDLKNLQEELRAETRFRRTLPPNPTASEFAERGGGLAKATNHGSVSTVHIPARRTVSVEYLVGEIKRRKTQAVAASFILLVGAVAFAYFLLPRNQTILTAADKKSIAVLPLKPINPADRDDLYEIGIADSLIQRLGSMKGFVVRHLSATQDYRNTELDPIAAGKEQQVDYVLSANYQLIGGRIRVTAKLLNVASGRIEQTYQIEKDAANTFAMQDEIAAEIGKKLLTQFATTADAGTAKRGTSNEEAYRLYLHGMYLANKRNSVDALEAVSALEQAVRLDPNYALAWAGLAYAQRAAGLRTGDAHEAHRKSIAAINRSLALDPNLSEAHSALCENKYLYEWDFVGAERECRRALELNPNSSQAHEIFSRYLMGRGRHDEAIAEVKIAIDLEPTSRFIQRNYGRALFYARRYPEAVTQFKRVIAMEENFLATYSWLAHTMALQGNEPEAFEWFLKLLSVRKADEATIQVFKIAFQTAGWRGVLGEWVNRLETVGGNNFDVAAYNAQLGNRDRAFEYLEKVYQLREYSMTYIQVDPRLDGLRADPRFAELVWRVESK